MARLITTASTDPMTMVEGIAWPRREFLNDLRLQPSAWNGYPTTYDPVPAAPCLTRPLHSRDHDRTVHHDRSGVCTAPAGHSARAPVAELDAGPRGRFR